MTTLRIVVAPLRSRETDHSYKDKKRVWWVGGEHQMVYLKFGWFMRPERIGGRSYWRPALITYMAGIVEEARERECARGA